MYVHRMKGYCQLMNLYFPYGSRHVDCVHKLLTGKKGGLNRPIEATCCVYYMAPLELLKVK